MDSQVAYPPAGNVYENAPPNVVLQQEVEGQEEQQQQQGQQGKKSVLKKVKAKAKKMKDTIAKRTTGQSNGAGDQVPDNHDLDWEDDEDEEMAEDNQQPELHGAPIYESTEARNPAVGETWSENRNGDGKRENSTKPLTPEILADWTKSTGSSKKDGSEEEELSKLNLSEPIDLEEDTQARTDPDHKLSHQFKVIDPSGEGSTEETAVTNLIRSFEKMNSESNPEPELQISHSPEDVTDFQSRIEDQFSPEPDLPTPEKMETEDYPTNQNGYTQKISAATSAFTDRAISAKNMVASKLGYGEKDNETETPEEYSAARGEDGSKFAAATSAIPDGAISAKNAVTSKLGYGQKDNERETIEENSASPGNDGSKLSDATSAIADKAIYTKNAVVSKLGYGEKDNEAEIPEANSAAPGEEGNTFSAPTSAIADRAISAKNMVVSKLGYGEKDNEAEISEANSAAPGEEGNTFSAPTSAIADRAISAKNAVVSKLGYGEKDSESVTHDDDGVKEPSASPVEYGKRVAGNVYEKVAGAGNTLASKVWGTPAGAEKEQDAAGGENKGVSVKDYLSEKLKPGEEDKALSEVISGTLYKNKEEKEPSETGERAATVTETEEENGDKQNVTGEGMVGKIKDSVGSFIGKGGPELQASPQAFGTSQGVEGFVDSGRRNEGEERRVLKESTN